MIRALILSVLLSCSGAAPAFRVNVPIPKIGTVTGSGFAVKFWGRVHLITAGHVCEAALAGDAKMSLTIKAWDGIATAGEYVVGRIAKDADLCELKAVVPAPRAGLLPLELAKYDPPQGARIVVDGAPYGVFPVHSEAQYVGRTAYEGRPFLMAVGQYTGPGNSGSPVMTPSGEVLGVLVMGGEFMFLAVPYEVLTGFLAGVP